MTTPVPVRIAPLLLGAGFAGHLLNILVFEPALGFSSPADFYDAVKFLGVVGHPLWKIGGCYHLLAAFSILVLSRSRRERRGTSDATGIGGPAAVLFLVVALTNFVGVRELGEIATLEIGSIEAVQGAFFLFRAVLLAAALVLLGAFLLLGNMAHLLPGSRHAGSRYTGVAAGVACLLQPIVPAIGPAMVLLVFAWGMIAGVLAGRPSIRTPD